MLTRSNSHYSIKFVQCIIYKFIWFVHLALLRPASIYNTVGVGGKLLLKVIILLEDGVNFSILLLKVINFLLYGDFRAIIEKNDDILHQFDQNDEFDAEMLTFSSNY